MSGHSHWAGIKHKKELEDKKRGKVFSKLARVITVAVKEGGGDPAMNPKLRDAIATAKSFNLPKDNIERAIQKGTGELAGELIESVRYEAFGPENIAIIIEAITDNKNRTLSDVKTILAKHGGKIAGEGSVRWMFEQKGVIRFAPPNQKEKTKEDRELEIIEAGADNLVWQDDVIEIEVNDPRELSPVRQRLETAGFTVESSRIEWVSKENIHIEDERKRERLEKLFEDLNDNDDVQDVYSNTVF